MTLKRTSDAFAAFASAAAALALPGQPTPAFLAVERALANVVGHKLFTVLAADMERRENERLHSSRPDAYPAGGRKPMRARSWGDQPLAERQPWLGRSQDDIRARMPDHATIFGLGLGACINLPVSFDGRFLGLVNILDVEGAYDAVAVATAAPFAMLLIPAFLAHLRSRP